MQRLIKYHFTTNHHFGFEAAAWYWRACIYLYNLFFKFRVKNI